jgi:hypothetical protein
MPRPTSSGVTYLGIDPGKNGGLVAILPFGAPIVTPMPETERDVWEWFRAFRGQVEATVEQVGGYTGDGQPGSAMFNFGWGYGGLRMALIAAGIPFSTVVPRTWQKTMGIPVKGKGESKSQFKERIRAKAQQRFPRLAIWSEPRSKGRQLAICDAMFIAEYGRRKALGVL